MMKKATVNKCNINSNNVYENSSGIDFYEVYADYNYSPLTNQYTAKKFDNDTFPDSFFFGAISDSKKPLNIFFEIKKEDNTVIYRNSFTLNNGYNERIIPFEKLNIVKGENYKVYFTGAKFEYENSNRTVQDNELMIAIK